MANIDMLVGEKVTFALVPTLNDQDADLVGIPRWSSSNAAIAGVNPALDGRTCEVTAKAVGGPITITADAQGSGALSASHTVTIAASNLADTLDISVQSPPQKS